MRVARVKAAHGRNAGVRPALGLHDAGVPHTTPPSLTNRWSGPALTRGQEDTFTLPDDVQGLLESGAKQGIGVSAPTGGQYLIFASCGELTIYYS